MLVYHVHNGSNVNDFLPSDTVVLTPDKLEVGIQYLLCVYYETFWPNGKFF